MISYQIKSNRISFKLELDDVLILIDSAIPLGLVLNELISNVFKHAFPNNAKGEISIRLYKEENGMINLFVSDNGIGVSADFELRKMNSMGLQTVFTLLDYQLKGQIKYEKKNGLKWHFRFKANLNSKRV